MQSHLLPIPLRLIIDYTKYTSLIDTQNRLVSARGEGVAGGGNERRASRGTHFQFKINKSQERDAKYGDYSQECCIANWKFAKKVNLKSSYHRKKKKPCTFVW